MRTRDDTNGHDSSHMPSPAEVRNAFSVPALFTPTPALQFRPRTRFNLAPRESTTPEEDPEDGAKDEATWRAESRQPENDPMTPHAHKRSFLLGVINSTAKPRRRFLPTPHPPRVKEEDDFSEALEALEEEDPDEYEAMRLRMDKWIIKGMYALSLISSLPKFNLLSGGLRGCYCQRNPRT